ncbi:hypothetical protein J7L68_01240 [bacterium]|nr:hypothetical protein [bacterium]
MAEAIMIGANSSHRQPTVDISPQDTQHPSEQAIMISILSKLTRSAFQR